MHRTLYIFRHGQTDWNIHKRFQGHTDIELNEVGREQAKRLGGYFANKPLKKIYTSDMKRAVETAKIVVADKSIAIEKTSVLREAHLGQMEGLHIDEARSKFGEEVIDRWKSNEKQHLDQRFPGGESKREMLARVNQYIDTVIHHEAFDHIGISTHGGVIHKLISHLMGVEHFNYPVTNCSLFVFEFFDSRYKFIEYQDFSKE